MNVERAEELAKADRLVRPKAWSGGWVAWDPGHGCFVDCTGCRGHSLGVWNAGSWVVLRKRGDSAKELAEYTAYAEALRTQLDVMTKLYEQAKEAGLHVALLKEAHVEMHDEADRLRATIARLEADLEQSEAQDDGRCQQLHDQAATIVGLRAELAISQELCGIRERKNQALKSELADALDTVARLSPAPEAPAAPVEVWHACSASEAREKHASGMRVQRDGWVGSLRQCIHTYSSFGVVACEQLLRDTGKAGWAWSEPLAEEASP